MKTIHKYNVPPADEWSMDLPAGARLLSVQVQYGEPVLWALVDPAQPPVPMLFAIRRTGDGADDLGVAEFIGTFQLQNGALVFHLFCRGPA